MFQINPDPKPAKPFTLFRSFKCHLFVYFYSNKLWCITSTSFYHISLRHYKLNKCLSSVVRDFVFSTYVYRNVRIDIMYHIIYYYMHAQYLSERKRQKYQCNPAITSYLVYHQTFVERSKKGTIKPTQSTNQHT